MSMAESKSKITVLLLRAILYFLCSFLCGIRRITYKETAPKKALNINNKCFAIKRNRRQTIIKKIICLRFWSCFSDSFMACYCVYTNVRLMLKKIESSFCLYLFHHHKTFSAVCYLQSLAQRLVLCWGEDHGKVLPPWVDSQPSVGSYGHC